MHKITFLGFLLALALVVAPSTTHAHTTQAELLNTIAQLQAQINALVAAGNGSTGTYSSNGNVAISTGGVSSVTDDSATVFGNFRLISSSYADVWFEFGQTQSLNEDSQKGRAYASTESLYRGFLRGLEEGEVYYYRAVARGSNGNKVYGVTRSFKTDGDNRGNSSGNNNDDEPDVSTDRATDIDDDRADLEGEVDMNDFEDGIVFFVYGEDEDQVEDIEYDYDEYADIDEDGDDLQKVRVDSNLDGRDDYSETVTGLDDRTDYYFQICVEYEDEDNDETIDCGGVEDFETDRNGGSSSSNDDEPDVSTDRAEDVEDDRADLTGEVDMNDFEDGTVFFVFGEDESQVEDVQDDYDEYNDIEQDGDDLQKISVDYSLDGAATYTALAYGLNDDSDYYFQICVEYDEDDDDFVLECGGVEEFTTDD